MLKKQRLLYQSWANKGSSQESYTLALITIVIKWTGLLTPADGEGRHNILRLKQQYCKHH